MSMTKLWQKGSLDTIQHQRTRLKRRITWEAAEKIGRHASETGTPNNLLPNIEFLAPSLRACERRVIYKLPAAQSQQSM